MDPHMDMDMDKDKDTSTPKAYQPRPHPPHQHQQQPPQPQQGHRIASPQSHMLPQQGPSAHIMPPQQRPPTYYGSPPGPAAPPSSAAGHYRRPSSPGPYGNPPPGTYGSAPSATSYAPAYGRHPDYAKDDYRYSQQQQQQQQPSDRRRDYETAEHSHEYAPISRDLYRSSSPTRHHHQQTREPAPVAATASIRRSAPNTASASYASHRGQTNPQIYQNAGPGHDQDMHEREHGMRAAHSPPLSRTGHPPYSNSAGSSRSYPARSPSPGPYGSSPDNMSYRHYYEQQQQHQRT
ncbi:hypothetical protein BGZ96_010809 [Linnemannia gamsii]|uniref:Uncharacterized protein n=1 Tax=Linnemannia gamsii TaxID=64522 RepID=A0ABQ7JUK6_9FUNG|nr:hypothetical protein BGZ96_010809 [Linnemannia gamsii]